MVADSVDGTGIENPAASGLPGRFIEIVHAFDIGIPNNIPFAFGRLAAEMQYAVAPVYQRQHGIAVRQIGIHDFFIRGGIAQIGNIRDPDFFSDVAKVLPERPENGKLIGQEPIRVYDQVSG